MKEENHRPTRGVRSNVIKSQKVTEWVPLIGCEMTGEGRGTRECVSRNSNSNTQKFITQTSLAGHQFTASGLAPL